MKILVCISQVPDTTTKIAFSDNNTKFAEAGVQWIVNPYDEWYALVRALELQEKGGSTVTLLNVGLAANDAVIRKALAIGGDDAVRIDADPQESYFVANQIAAYAKSESFDLVLFGKETINYNGSEVPGMVAELLNAPFISQASKLEVEGNGIVCERPIEGGVEVVASELPAVVSAQKGMAEARIPNMRGIMAARTKPLKVVSPVSTDKLTEIFNYSLPDAKSAVKLISPDNMDELVRLLHEEAKAI
jgi:electron transfer flavoprotein beta subunit